MRRTRRPDPGPLDVDAVRVVTLGTLLWALALLASLANLSTLRAHGHLWWVATASAGSLLGLLGIAYCWRRRTALRRPAGPSRPVEADELPPPLA